MDRQEKVVTLRGLFWKIPDSDNVICTEYTGTQVLLTKTPETIVSEEGQISLTEFLYENLEDSSIVSIKRVVTPNLEDLFNDEYIRNEWVTHSANTISTSGMYIKGDPGIIKFAVAARVDDPEVMIFTSLREIIWGISDVLPDETYMYVEITVTPDK